MLYFRVQNNLVKFSQLLTGPVSCNYQILTAIILVDNIGQLLIRKNVTVLFTYMEQ